jgi:hypothetical protein
MIGFIDTMKELETTGYFQWIRKEGLPTVFWRQEGRSNIPCSRRALPWRTALNRRPLLAFLHQPFIVLELHLVSDAS